MKWNTLLLIGTALSTVTLPSQAQTAGDAPKAPAETTAADSRLANVPPTTEEEKKAILDAIEFATIEGGKFGFANQKLIFQNPDEFIKKLLEVQVTVTGQMLNGELKDKLPAFYKEYLTKSEKLCKETLAQLASIENITASPKLKELEKKNKEAMAIYEAYLMREMGFDMNSYAMQEGQKLAALINSVLQSSDSQPSLAKLKKEIEVASSPEEKQKLQQAFMDEVFNTAAAQFKQNKRQEEEANDRKAHDTACQSSK